MFEFILVFLFVQQVCSIDEQTIPVSKHPVFIKMLGLLDQLLEQVRQMQTFMIRADDLIDLQSNDLRPLFAECVTAMHNASRIQYSLKLNEAEITRIPQIKAQLKQATTLTQLLNVMNITNTIITDITSNIMKPSLSFVTEIFNCINKIQMTIG